MKKLLLIFTVAVLAGGIAWAQIPPPLEENGFYGRLGLDVVPLLSTQATSTGRIFRSTGEAFINPRFHDPEMEGTFMFWGGDLRLSGNPDDASYRADFGFARNFGAFYMGFYFGGGFVDAGGTRTTTTGPDVDIRHRTTIWDANLAVLIGIANMGFRLDLGIVNEEGSDNTRDSTDSPTTDTVIRDRASAPSVALTWGARMGDLAPWARIGFRAANSYRSDITNLGADPVYTTETINTSNGGFEIAAGAEFGLGESSVLGGDIWFGTTSRTRERFTTTASGAEGRARERDDRLPGSPTGFGLGFYYERIIDFDSAAFGFRPNMNLGVTGTNRNHDLYPPPGGGAPASWEVLGSRWFTLNFGVDVGARWQATERMALYTGVTVRAFEWNTWSETGRNNLDSDNIIDASASNWWFDGIQLRNLNIGMVFTPAESIVLGLNLGSFIDGLFGTQFRPTIDFTVSVSF